ncbi:TrmB family transcriptional regulator [Natrinema saccharevitans]|uniref:TrmB family transcriptional regulator n=1 Tax=Natrinema saccharevitans TaxID=301967 RepID=UPI001115AC94|nr:TrmB family transcriptional regulator [Natrinema saccharevitans]
MNESAERPTRCPRKGRDGVMGCDPRRVMDLRNDDARAAYLYAEEPTTVNEIAEALDIPQSTAYRKVERLEGVGDGTAAGLTALQLRDGGLDLFAG